MCTAQQTLPPIPGAPPPHTERPTFWDQQVGPEKRTVSHPTHPTSSLRWSNNGPRFSAKTSTKGQVPHLPRADPKATEAGRA